MTQVPAREHWCGETLREVPINVSLIACLISRYSLRVLGAGTDEADAQLELKHATAQGNVEAQNAAREKIVCPQTKSPHRS